MKKLFLLMLVALLVVSIVSCGETKTVSGNKNDSKGETEKLQTPEDNATEEILNSEETTAPEPETEEPKTNEFYNDTNYMYDENAVSIKPRYLYWEDNTLVAECFVINGYTSKAYNINVTELMFANSNGVIASAAFGELSGLVLEPHTYAVWTFRFNPDVVSAPDADLSYLIYRSTTNQSIE